MLSDLFDDPASINNNSNNGFYKNKSSIAKPVSKRNENNLCGIINQGATCYLNTLLQTLFLTRTFRGINEVLILLNSLKTLFYFF
jgi:uncharacterized UBP type Zn finger protein